MRILANFSKKVSTGNYENETFTVTIECETEFNNVAEVADYLFREAEAAVLRQMNGKNSTDGKPTSTLPESSVSDPAKQSVPESLNRKSTTDTQIDRSKMTDSQRRYLFRLLAERGIENDEAHEKLKEHFSVSNLKNATKAQASELIDQLVNEKESVPV